MKTPDKKHPTVLLAHVLNSIPPVEIDPTNELGVHLMQLRYDCLLPVLEGMRDEALRQNWSDHHAGRLKLCTHIGHIATKLNDAIGSLREAIRICQPYIDAERASGTAGRERSQDER